MNPDAVLTVLAIWGGGAIGMFGWLSVARKNRLAAKGYPATICFRLTAHAFLSSVWFLVPIIWAMDDRTRS